MCRIAGIAIGLSATRKLTMWTYRQPNPPLDRDSFALPAEAAAAIICQCAIIRM